MTTFDGRERGYENKFAHDQEKEFKILARSTRLLGLWAAEQMKLAAESTEKYAESLLELIVKPKADTLVAEKLESDFSENGVQISRADIEKELARFQQEARDQVVNVG